MLAGKGGLVVPPVVHVHRRNASGERVERVGLTTIERAGGQGDAALSDADRRRVGGRRLGRDLRVREPVPGRPLGAGAAGGARRCRPRGRGRLRRVPGARVAADERQLRAVRCCAGWAT